jgi:hypothetical protein
MYVAWRSRDPRAGRSPVGRGLQQAGCALHFSGSCLPLCDESADVLLPELVQFVVLSRTDTGEVSGTVGIELSLVADGGLVDPVPGDGLGKVEGLVPFGGWRFKSSLRHHQTPWSAAWGVCSSALTATSHTHHFYSNFYRGCRTAQHFRGRSPPATCLGHPIGWVPLRCAGVR